MHLNFKYLKPHSHCAQYCAAKQHRSAA